MQTPTKEKLIQDLETSFEDIINWINEQPEDNFNKELVEDKWTIAGHLYHLIKSTKAVSKGMKMPKIVLKSMFGKSNRPERSFDELKEKYKSTLRNLEGNFSNPFEAEKGRLFERTALVNRFEGELNDFVKALSKWKEADMSIYIMPHPAIGKCTIREFVYFTIFHTNHHLDILKEKYSV